MSARRKIRRRQAKAVGKGSSRSYTSRRNLILMVTGVALAGLALWLMFRTPTEENLEFPTFAYNSAMTLQGFKAALRVPEVFSVIPCYCGCGPAQGHTSLEDCFFKPDGSFNDHASNCHLCVEEAVDVGKWQKDGLALKQIRTQIEQKYSGHGPSTNTPPLM